MTNEIDLTIERECDLSLVTGSAGTKKQGFNFEYADFGGFIHNHSEETIKKTLVKISYYSTNGMPLTHDEEIDEVIFPHRSIKFFASLFDYDENYGVEWKINKAFFYSDYDLLKTIKKEIGEIDLHSMDITIKTCKDKIKQYEKLSSGSNWSKTIKVIVIGLFCLPAGSLLAQKTGYDLLYLSPLIPIFIACMSISEYNFAKEIETWNRFLRLPMLDKERMRATKIFNDDYHENKVARGFSVIYKKHTPAKQIKWNGGSLTDNQDSN